MKDKPIELEKVKTLVKRITVKNYQIIKENK